MHKNSGQASIEYIATLVMTILFIGFLLAQVDTPIKRWWDRLALKIAAPCPTPECIKSSDTQPTVP
ncbi:MAG: hypothetical protein A2Z91_04435 [Deltaproteobacteria bacterium GWA2_38_16]|nr:MAG: hypothetical protein A2Z91_04435 [Deltaproteobacteria bacterium GWA2_38_16]OGQ01749.1 MAG: hypothetical protein A3D19_07745 [Deltaproteobacteria bacterium RIFCSPHIGHO2_02_FULL_38_15]OGQ33430.1 MAG: hypothetical protein A3A72_00615 [Deltaproteobacteria bacterium RIFCSPLOWO2_01_FULL_38_9]HBQ21448.1 hypothetical protein [Deltaproteobacteria bacterium]